MSWRLALAATLWLSLSASLSALPGYTSPQEVPGTPLPPPSGQSGTLSQASSELDSIADELETLLQELKDSLQAAGISLDASELSLESSIRYASSSIDSLVAARTAIEVELWAWRAAAAFFGIVALAALIK